MTRARESPASQVRGRSRLHLRQARTSATRIHSAGSRGRPGSPTGSLTGCQRPPPPSHVQPQRPRNTWSDGTSSHIWHRLATLRNRLTVKQVHREVALGFADLWHRRHATADHVLAAFTGNLAPGADGVSGRRRRRAAVRVWPSGAVGFRGPRAPGWRLGGADLGGGWAAGSAVAVGPCPIATNRP